MFGRRLHKFLNYQTRVSCLKFHSNNYIPKVNLTVSYHQIKRNNVYLKKSLLPIYTGRSYSNLTNESKINEENEFENEFEDDENIVHDDKSGAKKLSENLYFYDLLRNSDKYKKTVIPRINCKQKISDDVVDEILAKNYEDFTVTEILEDFKTISRHAGLHLIKPSQDLHAKLFDIVAKYIPDLLDDQLWDVLRHVELWFPMIRKLKPESFQKLTDAIDESLCKRINDFSPDEMLMSCDLMYHLREPRYSQFINKVITKLGSKPKKMSPENYIHFMFIMNIVRKSAINMYELEYALESIIDKFDANELGVVAIAFFKTDTPIRNSELLEKIIQKCTSDMDKMGDISISAVMKLLRYCLKNKSDFTSFRKLLRAFESRIDTTSAPCLVHAGHATATVLVYEKDIIDKIVTRFNEYIPSARAKDLERMLYVLMIYNYPKDSSYYKLIVEELRNPARAEEFQSFFKSFRTSIMYLSHAGIYPLDIIRRIMDHDYLRVFYNNNSYKIGSTYSFIDSSLRIEVPEYTGPFLPLKVRSYLNKKYSAAFSYYNNPEVRTTMHQKILFDVQNLVRQILGTDKCVVDQLLPHHMKADIVFCVDSDNNPVVPKEFKLDSPVGTIKYAPKEPAGHKWIVIVIASYSQIFRATSITSGVFNSKLRQLEKIGYTPIIVSATIWRELLTTQNRKEYLHNLLKNYHNEKK